MSANQKDSLLTAARIVTILLTALALIIAVTGLFAMFAIPFNREAVLAELALKDNSAAYGQILMALEIILGLVVAMAACALNWLDALRKIIASVSLGDPFAPANADRLQRMGWLTVAVELLAIPVGGIGSWLASVVKDATAEFGLSLGGILLALVLFILARVFRNGAEMRAELEGTV